MEFLNDYIVLVVVGVCLCVGYIMKNVIPSSKVNRYIPAVVAILGVLLNVWINGWHLTPAVLLGGMFSGLASTGMYEAFKNIINK